MRELSGKVVLVTGGGQGVGRGISAAFTQLGARVITVSRDPDSHGLDRAAAIEADLTTPSGCQEVARWFDRYKRRLDALVNNAGIARFLPLARSDEAVLDEHVALNLLAPFRLTRALLPWLQVARGSVSNVSSYFARRMLPGRPSAACSMTKGGLESLTRALAFELGPEGVRVNAIAPGAVDTPMFRHNLSQLSESVRQAFQRSIHATYPLARLGSREDIGLTAAFIASDAARRITGAVVPVDGGLTTH